MNQVQQPMHQARVHNPNSYVALCCQTIGVGDGRVPMLARVAIVDYRGHTLYDSFVLPSQAVVNYRTEFTGLQPHHLHSGTPFDRVQQVVANIIKDKIVVGYQLWVDFSVLGISHLTIDTRDVSLFMPFRNSISTRPDEAVSLQTLVWELMRRRIRAGYQHPLEDARAACKFKIRLRQLIY